MGCTASSANDSTVELIDFTERCRSPTVRFHEETLSIDGARRNLAAWRPLLDDRIRGIVCIAHGLGEHALCYAHVAHALVARDFAVYALDHVAHGLSDSDANGNGNGNGRRGVVPSERIVSDFVFFVQRVRERHAAALPVSIVAHSMGTLVALNALSALRDTLSISALVLSGAALFSGPAASSPFGVRALYPLSQTSFAAGLTSVMAAVDPAGPAAPIVVEEVTSNTQLLAEMKRDPRRNPPAVANRTARVLIGLIAKAKECVKTLDMPVLCLHGEADQLTLKRSSEFIYENVSTDAARKKLLILPGCKHEVFNEPAPHGPQAIAAAVDFIEEHFPVALDKLQVVLTETEDAQTHSIDSSHAEPAAPLALSQESTE